MVFHRPLFATQVAEVREILRQIVKPLALFFLIRPGFGFNAQGTHGSSAVIDIGAFSQRQLLVLKSITDSKTNNVIARELGFSVSTIRHETMRIFEILSVSDRREAAQKAVSLGIV
jgi:DNA-binding NarL/FixJ family response regulator